MIDFFYSVNHKELNIMDEKTRLRQLELQTGLYGMWDNDNGVFSYFFYPDTLDLLIGGLPIGNFKYEAFIKPDDDNPYLTIYNDKHPSGDTQVKEYKIVEINTKTGILKLLNDFDVELNFHQRKSGFHKQP